MEKEKKGNDNLGDYIKDLSTRTRKEIDREDILEKALDDYRSIPFSTGRPAVYSSRLLLALSSISWTERRRALEAIALFSEAFTNFKALCQTNKSLPTLLKRTIDDVAAHPKNVDAEQVRNYSLSLVSRWLKQPNAQLLAAKAYIEHKHISLPIPLLDEKIPLLIKQRNLVLSSVGRVIVNVQNEEIDTRKRKEEMSLDRDPPKDECSSVLSEASECISSALSLLRMLLPEKVQEESTREVSSSSSSSNLIETSSQRENEEDEEDSKDEKDKKGIHLIKDEEWEDIHEIVPTKNTDLFATRSTSIHKNISDGKKVSSENANDANEAIIESLRDSILQLRQDYLPQLLQFNNSSSLSSLSSLSSSSWINDKTASSKLIAEAKRVIEAAKVVGVNPELTRQDRKKQRVQ
jgi:hypothetical protein